MAMALDMQSADFEQRFAALLAAKRESSTDVDAAVAVIIADVRARGDEALADLSLRFDRVLKVSHLGLRPMEPEATLNLLAVTFEKTDPPAGMIILAFADGALVRLEVECVEVELRDMGDRVPAEACPGHALTDTPTV